MPNKKQRFTVTLPKDMVRQLDEVAGQQDRSRNNVITRALRVFLQERYFADDATVRGWVLPY